MFRRVLTALIATTCLWGQIWADEYEDTLARIEALTDQQIFDVIVGWITENAEDCQFEIDRAKDNSDLQKELAFRWVALVGIPDDQLPTLGPRLMERAGEVDTEAMARAYFSDIVVDEQSRTFILPDCTVGLS